jgi:hypothetical protein
MVPQEPPVLNDSSTNRTTLASVSLQEPKHGSAGTTCFERQFYKSDDFRPRPRAAFIILNKARGGPRKVTSRARPCNI